MAYLIGLDIGTTSVKACLFKENGQFIDAVEYEIETLYKQQNWAEQDVRKIEKSCREAIIGLIKSSKIVPSEIMAVSFCSAMHSLLAVNEANEPLTDAIIWSDRRSYDELELLAEQEKQVIYNRTGTPIHPMTPFSKLLWMKKHKHQLYQSKPNWMSIKEYIILKWFNIRWVDYSMASATGLMNLDQQNWDKELLSQLQLDVTQLSIIYSPQQQLPRMNDTIRLELGLTEKTIFVLGAADGQLASLGVGAIMEGELAVSVGTSGAIREYSHQIQLSDERATFCYLFDQSYYIVGGPTNNGGVILQWLKQLLAKEIDYDSFLKLAKDVSIGANGILFLPYLNGERAPLWNAEAKGVFFGLSIEHQIPHMVRAAVEGITYNLYHILHSKTNSKTNANKLECIYVNGGLSRSTLWLQMVADMFNCKVYSANTHHGAAWGACWVALMSIGKQTRYEDIKHTISYEQPILPNAERHKLYLEQYERFTKLLGSVKDLY